MTPQLTVIPADSFRDAFEPYFLPLCIWWTPNGEERSPDDPHYLYSGFLLDIEGAWYWFTAGHVFTAISKAEANGYYVSYCAFIEPKSKGGKDVQIAWSSLEVVYFDEDHGLDVGWFRLSNYAKTVLEAGKIDPLSSKNVAGSETECEGYAVVGIPEETVSIEHDEPVSTIQAALIALPLKKLETERKDEGVIRLTFQARPNGAYVEDKPLQSVKGMSGGFVAGIKGTTFVLIGVQSAWDSHTWQLKAIPLWPAVLYLKSQNSL